MENLKKEYDIIIVGAGPAGCAMAKEISSSQDVLLIDKSNIHREKICGGLLVEEAMDIITKWKPPEDIFEKPKELSLMYIDFANELVVEQKRKIINISRLAFDNWLLSLVNPNVTFLPHTKLLCYERSNDILKTVVMCNNQKISVETKYLIGADGSSSIIYKSISKKRITPYVGMQKWLSVNKSLGDKVYFIYDENITNFYSWVIPKNKGLIIGSAVEPHKKNNFQILEKALKDRYKIEGNVLGPGTRPINRPKAISEIVLGSGNVLLIGEAAGLISPATAEGISFALRSGLLCAKAFKSNKEPFYEYTTLCKPLIYEIKGKIEKSKILSNKVKRSQWLRGGAL